MTTTNAQPEACNPLWHRWSTDDDAVKANGGIPFCTKCLINGCEHVAEECYACSFSEPIGGLKPYPMQSAKRCAAGNFIKWLCDLCASSHSGAAYEYPEQYGNSGVIMGTLNAGLNQIRVDIANNYKVKD